MGSAHRATLKKGHKPFKSRHASKGTIKTRNKGKVEKDSTTKRHANSNAQKLASGSKQEKKNRKNQSNQIKINKNIEIATHKNLFEGKHGAPKMVTVIALCDDCNPAEAVVQLNQSVEATTATGAVPSSGVVDVNVDRFKQKLKYIIPSSKNLIEILDAARVADFVLFVLSPEQEVDEFGELCVRSIESQGVSNCIPIVSNLANVGNTKKQQDVKNSLLSYFSHFFPATDKIYAPENESEASNVARMLCQKFPQGVTWRDSRPYMLADEVSFDEDSQTVVVDGVLRGQGINADRLVHIPEFGDFQIDRVEGFKMGHSQMDTSDDDNCLARPGEDQESLDELAPAQENDDEMEPLDTRKQTSVRMEGHDYMEEEESDDEVDDEDELRRLRKPRRLPKGMSADQAAWIFDDDLEEDDDGEEEEQENGEEEEDDAMEDEEEPARNVASSEYAPTEAETETHTELTPEEEEKQLKEFRNRAKDDMDFPDEIELHPNELGRERLKRYRGVNNLRHTYWNPHEHDDRTPQDWRRLSKVANFRATKNRVMKEAITQAQVSPGQRVRIYIRAPKELVSQSKRPFMLFGLLHHEHQQSVMNYTITPNSEYDLVKNPLAAKTDLIVQCGPRRLVVQPLFSQSGNNSGNGVYKYERFLQPGRPSTATVIAPLTFGNVPVLFFKDNGTPVPDLVGTGTVLDANSNRVLAKRSVLTGHPFKIHKKVVTVRYMFFNPEDVLWFKPVPLFTKSGRTGYIKEKLGTHGYFKATFDGRLTPQDVVGLALYKRVWPRYSRMWSPHA